MQRLDLDEGYGIVSTMCDETFLTVLKMLLARNAIIADTCQSHITFGIVFYQSSFKE